MKIKGLLNKTLNNKALIKTLKKQSFKNRKGYLPETEHNIVCTLTPARTNIGGKESR